jgi:integrase
MLRSVMLTSELRNYAAFDATVLAALQRAGLRRVNMHSLRHSFASALIMAGAPVTEVQAGPCIADLELPWLRQAGTRKGQDPP